MKTLISIIAVIVFLNIPVFAQDKVPVDRIIMAIYDSRDEFYNREDKTLIHQCAEMPLNYLGFTVKYHDMAQGFPEEDDLKGVRGFITWNLDNKISNAGAFCKGITEQIAKGKKYLLIGELGAEVDAGTGERVPRELLDSVYNALGLDYQGNWTDNILFIDVVDKNSDMVEYERTLDKEAMRYETVVSINRQDRIYLTLVRTDIPGSESAAVAVTGSGGYIMSGYAVFQNNIDGRKRWRVNPFRFFSEVFGNEDMPVYDTTTLFGTRISYSHIDGDGLRNISYIDKESYSGEIIKKNILDKYQMPITVSFITAEIDPDILGSDRLKRLATDICELSNIEVGVHGFSHPLDWDNMITAFAIPGYSGYENPEGALENKSESHYEGYAEVEVDREEYLDKEIAGSADYLDNNILTDGKRTLLFQWTGDCEPGEKAILLHENRGLLNINGGDTRLDRVYPSYNGVAPLARQIGDALQVYTSNSNENIYTNSWTGPFYGFRNVIETFEQTEYPTLIDDIPRRVSPFNIYYHFYSGERELALDALKEVYNYVSAADHIPIFTTDYIRIVQGFMSGKIKKLDDNVWELYDYGMCRTVRLEGPYPVPDMDRSSGVLGYEQWEGYIYVHLADTDHAVLYLTDTPSHEPYIMKATSDMKNVDINDNGFSFDTRIFGSGHFDIANMGEKQKYRITAVKDDGNIIESTVKTGKEGVLSFDLEEKGALKVVAERS